MSERPVDQRTLREKFTEAERLTRELIEHIERGFLPKAAELEKLVQLHGGAPDASVPDVAVRTSAARLLAGEDFTHQLFETVQDYCRAIDRSVAEIVGDT